MAQALAFAYQNGECYGAKCVELAYDGKAVKNGGGVGGFTQADIDNARVDAVREAAKNLTKIQNALEAKKAEIAELKKQLGEKTDDPVTNLNPAMEKQDGTPISEPGKEANIENMAQA